MKHSWNPENPTLPVLPPPPMDIAFRLGLPEYPELLERYYRQEQTIYDFSKKAHKKTKTIIKVGRFDEQIFAIFDTWGTAISIRDEDVADEDTLRHMFSLKNAELDEQIRAQLAGRTFSDNRRISVYGPGVQWAIKRPNVDVQDEQHELENSERKQFPARFIRETPPMQHLQIMNESASSSMW
jgi:hypothetical protein